MIKISNNPDVTKWGEFVYKHPNGNIFQTPEMAEVYKVTKNYEPISLAAIDQDEIIGVLQGVNIKEKSGIFGSLSARSIIQGGPLFINDEKDLLAAKSLIESYNKIAGKKALYTQVRNINETNMISNIFEDIGFKYYEHLNFLIDLNRPVEQIWKDLQKPRRKGINRAKENGLKLVEVQKKSDLNRFYELLKETYMNVKVPLADISLFKSAFDNLVPKNMATFYFAQYDDSYIGARVVLNYKKTVFDWYAGASIKHLSLYVNEFMVWNILEESSKKGFHLFDFGGAGSPYEEYGVREFKRRFGGKMVNYGRLKIEYSPMKLRIAEKGFKVYKKIFI